MKKIYTLFLMLIVSLFLSGCIKKTPPSQQADNQTTGQKQTLTTKKETNMKTLTDFEVIEATQAAIKTNKGEIVVKLYREKAPITTANFLNLAKAGFYDGMVFHRVINGFMIQTGDPLSKDESQKNLWGTGGPGYAIPDEFNQNLKHDGPGILSMANSGPNTGGSQFFITHVATPWLDGKHTIFGKVIEGMDVVNSIVQGDKIETITFE